jgi:hypothetical protein
MRHCDDSCGAVGAKTKWFPCQGFLVTGPEAPQGSPHQKKGDVVDVADAGSNSAVMALSRLKKSMACPHHQRGGGGYNQFAPQWCRGSCLLAGVREPYPRCYQTNLFVVPLEWIESVFGQQRRRETCIGGLTDNVTGRTASNQAKLLFELLFYQTQWC